MKRPIISASLKKKIKSVVNKMRLNQSDEVKLLLIASYLLYDLKGVGHGTTNSQKL